ncbi:MAG: OmpH family outer membrane protein [Gemmatimonadales bacterium]|nr:OmpH family outer membrane protein [Gemmatimonadales bacterium]
MIVVLRRLAAGVGLVLLAGVGSAAAQQQPGGAGAPAGGLRIAFVNASALLRGMPGYAKAESTYTKEATAAQAEAQKIQAGIDSAIAQYQQSQAMLSPSARTAREKSLGAQRDSAEARLQTIQERLNGRERELISPMQQRLGAIIEGMRAEGNYALILDVGNPNFATFFVAYDKSLDITTRVAQRLLQSN